MSRGRRARRRYGLYADSDVGAEDPDYDPGRSRRELGGSGAGAGSGRRETRGTRPGEFQDSVARLERAVDDLVGTARARFSDRAGSFIDQTADRLERELSRREQRSGRAAREPEFEEPLPRRLQRDPSRARIKGVCAGIARYYAVEPWVVRCVAITGLIFFPTLVFPAYWVAYFIMDGPPNLSGRARRRRRRERSRRSTREDSSPTPELGPRFSPRSGLRNVKADLTEVELRLRRMETHVTSGRYELQRELHKIDGGTDGTAS